MSLEETEDIRDDTSLGDVKSCGSSSLIDIDELDDDVVVEPSTYDSWVDGVIYDPVDAIESSELDDSDVDDMELESDSVDADPDSEVFIVARQSRRDKNM